MRNATETVLWEDSAAFVDLFKVATQDAEAIGALAEKIVSQPPLFFVFGSLFSDPSSVEAARLISQDPALDLSGLQGWIERTPSALMVAAGLAQVGNESVRRMILRLQPDPALYQEAVNQDPAYLPYLILMVETGYSNILNLLIQLVWGGNELILSSMVGIAAEGSGAAFAALNAGVTASHLATLFRFAEQYGDDPVHGERLLKVLQSPSFNPLFFALGDGEEGNASRLTARLAHFKSPGVLNPWIPLASPRAAQS